MKNADFQIVFKVLAPRLIAKALATLDKSTMFVVGVCWLVALVTLVAALLAVHEAVVAKKDAAQAIVSKPILPETVTTKIDYREGQAIVARLQHQFPDIKFEVDKSPAIIVKADEGSKFHQWITALAYLDTVSPQYRWTLRSFCVGHCSGQDLMKAEVTGQKVVFSLPQSAH